MSEVDHLLNEAMKLTEAQRAELAHRLLETVNEEDAFASMDPEERVALEAAIEEGYEDFEKGDVVDGLEFAKSLASRR